MQLPKDELVHCHRNAVSWHGVHAIAQAGFAQAWRLPLFVGALRLAQIRVRDEFQTEIGERQHGVNRFTPYRLTAS